MKWEVTTNSRVISNEIFRRADKNTVSKGTHCRILKTVARRLMPVEKPFWREIHQENRVKWAEEYTTPNFSKVVFTDETHATLDGPDCRSRLSRGWVANGCESSSGYRRPQGRGGLMIWAGIINGIMVRLGESPKKYKLLLKPTERFWKSTLSLGSNSKELYSGERWYSYKIMLHLIQQKKTSVFNSWVSLDLSLWSSLRVLRI